MRLALLCLLPLAACVNLQPYTATAPAPAGARECIANKITALGYEIEYQTPDRSTVRARKGQGAGGIDIVLTATVFTSGGAEQIRVVSEGIERRGTPQELRLGSVGATRAEADQVLAECRAH